MNTQRVTKIITIHPKQDMNMCPEFHGNLSNTTKDISLWCWKKKSPTSFQAWFSSDHVVTNIHTAMSQQCIHNLLGYFSLDQSGGLPDQATDQH